MERSLPKIALSISKGYVCMYMLQKSIQQYFPRGRNDSFADVNWYFVENEFHSQINLGNTGLNKVNRFLVNSSKGKLTYLPKRILYISFIHSFRTAGSKIHFEKYCFYQNGS